MTYLEQLQALLKHFTQSEVADLLGVTERSIQNYVAEEGSRVPHPKTQRKIEEIFTKLLIQQVPLSDMTTGTPTRSTLENRRAKSSNPVMAPFLPVKAQAGYVNAYDQTVFIDNLEKYALPPGIDPHGAVWRYWEVEGESMEPSFKKGDIILTSQVHKMDWENMRNFYLYVIVTGDRAMLKRVFCKNAIEWVLISENEDAYPQQLLPVEYIKEVWVYRRSVVMQASLAEKVYEIKV